MTKKIINYKNFKSYRPSSERGLALFYTLVIVSILLSLGLAISLILIGQIRIITGIGDSVIAFYAADTGMEKALMGRGAPQDDSGSLENESSYEVSIILGGEEGCDADNYCIQSVGSYRGVKRAIEAEY